MSKPASLETTPGPVLLPTPEVQQAQQLLARQQLAVAMDRARHAARTDGVESPEPLNTLG